MKKGIYFVVWLSVLSASCFTVKFISGYDEVLDQTLCKIKRDFNLHFIRLSRTFSDNDPNNQKFENFQDYYDNLEVDLLMIHDRTQALDGKAVIVKLQVQKLDSTFRGFINMHKKGIKDRPLEVDDRHTERDAVNSSIDAVILLQESLKTTGKTN
jgi:hypothetical protein